MSTRFVVAVAVDHLNTMAPSSAQKDDHRARRSQSFCVPRLSASSIVSVLVTSAERRSRNQTQHRFASVFYHQL